MTALNDTWTRSGNFGIERLTSPLEGTLRFLGISKTRRVPCSSVTARKCCLAAHKAKSNKYAVYSNLYSNLTSIYCQRLLSKGGNNLRKATQGLMHVILAFVMCSWTNAASLVFSSRFHTSILPSSFPM